jgi:hypothetical protein
MARRISQKQQHRELLVHKFMRASGYDANAAEAFDRHVCLALKIDPDKNPPHEFIGDILAAG